jgi:hypothetical protein
VRTDGAAVPLDRVQAFMAIRLPLCPTLPATKLGTATLFNETPSGWQTANFAAPI